MATEGKVWYKTIGSKIWYFFNSLKLTLFVLITLAVVSIFGTVIEQNQPVSHYLNLYGEKWTRFILAVRLNDMYHTKWFMSLLVMLTINIIVCTFERFPIKWKSLLHHKPERFDPRIIDKCSHHHALTMNGGMEAVAGRIQEVFKRSKYNIIKVGGDGGAHNFYAWKGIIGRFGSDFTHISLLLILAGAIVGGFAGFKDFKFINVGETVAVPYKDFQLRLDKFWIDYYDTGQIRQYNSLLTVVENGREVLKKQIWVNEPLYYKGVRFYQSSYGMAWDKIEDAKVALVKKSNNETLEPVTVKWGETGKVPGSDYSVKLVAYTADFAYDEATSTVYSKSAEANNPAIGMELYQGGKLVGTPWLFLKYPGIFPALPDSDYDLVFGGYRGIMYSGISLNQDPGTNIVWAGTIVMAIGFVLAFFVYHRRVWVHVRESGRSTEVKIGGLINKNNLVFEKELQEIVDSLTAQKSGQTPEGRQ